MLMHNPLHPGKFLKSEYLEPLGLSITKAAKGLSISRQMLSTIVNGKRPVTPDLAIRFAKAFGSTARVWLTMQANHDLWHAEVRAKKSKVKITDFRGPDEVFEAA